MLEFTERSSLENRLLAALPPKDRERLFVRLERLTLFTTEVVHSAGQEIQHVYFPLDSIVVLLSSVEADSTVESGLIGSEGMVGTPIVMGAKVTPSEAVVQSEGKTLRLHAADLKKEMKRSPVLRDVLLRYANALLTQSTQLAACHRYHTPQARLSRWLLMTYERKREKQIVVTQQFIARLLGTRRATVTEASQNLQRAGLIHSKRGKITLINPEALISHACTCYQVIRDQSFPPPTRVTSASS